MTKITGFTPTQARGWIPLNLDNVQYIIIHHIEAKTAKVEDINSWHLQNGWNGIGYNEYIRKDGTVYICRGYNVGAQCIGMNDKSYGIALEGDYETETVVPDTQMQALVERIKTNMPKFKNCKGIAPHKQFTSTQCPGKNFPFVKLLELVNKKEEVEEMVTAEQIKQLLGIKDANWAKEQLDIAKKSGLINGEHDVNEPVTLGMLLALLNKIYDK